MVKSSEKRQTTKSFFTGLPLNCHDLLRAWLHEPGCFSVPRWLSARYYTRRAGPVEGWSMRWTAGDRSELEMARRRRERQGWITCAHVGDLTACAGANGLGTITNFEKMAIGPLHDPVTWYGINYTGTQITQWDFQNKGKSGWTGVSSFVLEVPLRNLRLSVIYSVPRDRIVQRAYWNARPRIEQWPRQTASGDFGVLLQLVFT